MALQTMTIKATSFKGVRDGGEVIKNDAARFGRSTNGTWVGTITFTPEKSDLEKLKKSRITKIYLNTQLAALGGVYTKSISFGGKSFSFSEAYNVAKAGTVWTGNTLTETSGWGPTFLKHFKNGNSSYNVTVTATSATSSSLISGKDYAKNYGGLTSSTTLTVTYELLGSELNITSGQKIILGEENSVSLVRYDSKFSEQFKLSFLDDQGVTQTITINNISSTPQTQLKFILPLNLINKITTSTSRAATLTVSTYEGATLIGQNNYSITLSVPSEINFKLSTFSILSQSDIVSSEKINEKYFIQSFSKAKIEASFLPYTSENFTDLAVLKNYTLYINGSQVGSTKTFNSNSLSETTEIFTTAGDKTVQIKIQDSRGKQQSVNLGTFNVQEYSTPKINNISISRMLEPNVPNEEGINLLWDGNLIYSEVQCSDEINNSLTKLILSWGEGELDFKEFKENLSLGKYSAYVEGKQISTNNIEYFKTDTFYKIKAKIIDFLGQESEEREIDLTSTKYLIHFGQNGYGLGFGSSARYFEKITCGWDMFFNSESGALKISEGGTGVTSYEGLRKVIGDLMYPIGSIYMSVSNTNPSELFGGTWIAWGSGRVPVGIKTSDSNFNSVEKTGGETTHKLTINEMPSHNHAQQVWNRLAYGSGSQRSAAYWEEANSLVNLPAMSYTGGNAAHNNLQPYITCYMWKRTA